MNLAGSLLIGGILAWAEHSRLPPAWKAFCVTGVLGALTTFSTFAFESFQLWREGQLAVGLTNILVNVVGCLGVVAVGWTLGESLFNE